MSALLDLLTGGGISFAVVGTAIAVILGFFWRLLYSAKKSGIDQQKAEEADSYAKHLREIQDAANARPTGELSVDPRNRDNRT
ncbi:MAG: hypothetical protein E5Y10_24360 [Mesorhizobium sp.]|nr:MAG: hypothetical protein E5Y10_24360 [Mesorhizobium sp.]